MKRIRNNPCVELAPSDGRGKPLGKAVQAEARFIEGDTTNHALELLKRKYGFQFTCIEWLNRLNRGSETPRVFIEIVPSV